MKKTICEIARQVGCSPATVSRAMNSTATVEAGLRRRILIAARAGEPSVGECLKPHKGRPRGSLGRTGGVQIIVFRPDEIEPIVLSSDEVQVGELTEMSTNLFGSPRFRLAVGFYRHMIHGVMSVLSVNGVKAVQCERTNLTEESFLNDIYFTKLCGVIIMGSPGPEVEAFALACPHPVVLVNILGLSKIPVVAMDNSGAIKHAISHLRELGHSKIGYIGGSDQVNQNFGERYETFLGELLATKCCVNWDWISNETGHICDITEAASVILRQENRPTAIVCACDHYAVGVYEAAKQCGLRIPDDLSVVGVDDSDIASVIQPALTTVHVPLAQMGACAADLLLRMTARKGNPAVFENCEIRYKTELVVRNSTSVPPTHLSQILG